MQRITYFERQIIASGIRTGKSVRGIAKSIGRDHRVIQREVDRNCVDGRLYTAVLAQQIAMEREQKKNRHKLEQRKYAPLRKYVLQKLKEDWSPEQIAGVLKNQPPLSLNGQQISHESIYQYIYLGEGRYENVWQHLRKARTVRQKQRARKPRKASIPERISIHERGEEIDQRTTFGHWETDTLGSSPKFYERLSVQYERKGQLVRLNKVRGMGADETEEAIRKSIESLPQYLWKSITFDNGTEGTNHFKIRKDFNIPTYFCDAYASWQKGGVENLNGLLRQYIPKGTPVAGLTDQQIQTIQEKLNNRPRKSLHYLSPNQVFAQEFGIKMGQ